MNSRARGRVRANKANSPSEVILLARNRETVATIIPAITSTRSCHPVVTVGKIISVETTATEMLSQRTHRNGGGAQHRPHHRHDGKHDPCALQQKGKRVVPRMSHATSAGELTPNGIVSAPGAPLAEAC